MNNKQLRRGLAALALACAAIAPAQAGVVVGSYDPQFGPALPELSFRGSFSFNLPDSWLDHAVTHNNDFVDLTNENIWASASLTLFETLNPANAVSANFNLRVDMVRVDRTLLHLRSWSSFSPVSLNNPLNGFAPANFNQFDFHYANGLPQLRCLQCNSPVSGPSNADVLGDLIGFDQLVHHRDDAGQGRLKDSAGNDLALRSTISGRDQFGNYIVDYSQAPVRPSGVPEPGSLTLALGALAALLARRRRS